jgi:hypothetical protein
MQCGFDPLVVQFVGELMEVLARVHGRAKAPNVPCRHAVKRRSRRRSLRAACAESCARAGWTRCGREAEECRRPHARRAPRTLADEARPRATLRLRLFIAWTQTWQFLVERF